MSEACLPDVSFYGHVWFVTQGLHNSSIKSFKLKTLYTRVSSSYYHSMTMWGLSMGYAFSWPATVAKQVKPNHNHPCCCKVILILKDMIYSPQLSESCFHNILHSVFSVFCVFCVTGFITAHVINTPSQMELRDIVI